MIYEIQEQHENQLAVMLVMILQIQYAYYFTVGIYYAKLS